MDGADSLAKRERRTATSISDRGPQLLFISDATKLFELSGLRMVEEEVWRCHSVLCSPVLSVPPNTGHQCCVFPPPHPTKQFSAMCSSFIMLVFMHDLFVS